MWIQFDKVFFYGIKYFMLIGDEVDELMLVRMDFVVVIFDVDIMIFVVGDVLVI